LRRTASRWFIEEGRVEIYPAKMDISEKNCRELMGDTSLWLAQAPQLRLATDIPKFIEDGG
jgi:hypothetical protein